MNMLILDLCSGTGSWSKPYKDHGYAVIKVDITKGEDIRLFEAKYPNVYGILAAPPCTHLSGSGSRWWKQKGKEKLLEALSIVDACMRIIMVHNPRFWCIENPVGRLTTYLGKPKHTFHPNDYAGYAENPITNEYQKLTCLWGEFNIPRKKRGQMRKKTFIHTMGPSPDRAKERSRMSDGFAKAFFMFNNYGDVPVGL